MLSRLVTSTGSRHPTVHVRQLGGDAGSAWQFSEPFRIGRGEQCDIQISSGQVSRVHARVDYEDDAWWIIDEQSTNGLYVESERVERASIGGSTTVRLGKEGPELELRTEGESSSPRVIKKEASEPSAQPARRSSARAPMQTEAAFSPKEKAPQPSKQDSVPRPSESEQPADPSVSWYRRRYFQPADDGEPVGERTMYIRQAYQHVQKEQRRMFSTVLAGAAGLLLLVGAYAIYQYVQNQRLQRAAAELFYEIKDQDARLAQLARVVEETGGEDLQEILAEMQEARERLAEQYEGYVRELGVYRRLSEEERLIYRTARIFGESEFEIPAGFVRAVRNEINEYWLGPGRSRFINAVRRAEENGYVPFIVRTMQEHGLPPEMFYLALQESNFEIDAVGPATRWGIAKGMWQFIPTTGRAYGLRIGPREEVRVYDPQDDRHDFEAATMAAARYQAEIYSTLAQASGLLVFASYNWGENRVVTRLNQLFEGIPENPRERSYWRFLQRYEERMPEETKDYVLRIFAAAVIGQNPRHFGLDMDNPLLPYLEGTSDVRADRGRREADSSRLQSPTGP